MHPVGLPQARITTGHTLLSYSENKSKPSCSFQMQESLEDVSSDEMEPRTVGTRRIETALPLGMKLPVIAYGAERNTAVTSNRGWKDNVTVVFVNNE